MKAVLASTASSTAIEAAADLDNMVPLFTGDHFDKPRTILVKFKVFNEKQIPEGIRYVDRKNQAERDAYNAAVAKEMGLGDRAKRGAHRPRRVDTGRPAINVSNGVSADYLRRALAGQGYTLCDVHYYQDEEKQGKPYFIVLSFYPDVPADKKYDRPWLDKALRLLATRRWDFCNVWDNPDGTVTCNFSGSKDKEKPTTWHLGVKDKCLVLIPA